MAAAPGLKPARLSAYLAALERAGLITARRDGRAIFYAIPLGTTGGLGMAAGLWLFGLVFAVYSSVPS